MLRMFSAAVQLLKEKTAVPIIVLVSIALVNGIIHSGKGRSENRLHLTVARASAPASGFHSMIAESAVKSNGPALEDGAPSALLYQRFLKNNFIMPTTGINWGVLHGDHGVDIADACGKLVYAADAGLVVEASGANQWNGGYGNYVLIEHAAGVRTKYAHLRTAAARMGSYVVQGDAIGAIGNSGDVRGQTGCHLHFETHAAENPFANHDH